MKMRHSLHFALQIKGEWEEVIYMSLKITEAFYLITCLPFFLPFQLFILSPEGKRIKPNHEVLCNCFKTMKATVFECLKSMV